MEFLDAFVVAVTEDGRLKRVNVSIGENEENGESVYQFAGLHRATGNGLKYIRLCLKCGYVCRHGSCSDFNRVQGLLQFTDGSV